MATDLTIRLMKPGEETVVSTLVAKVFDEFVSVDFPPEGIEEFYRFAQPDALAGRSQSTAQVLVAEQDNRIVGMLEVIGLNHISMLFVETRGKGIGRALIEKALQMCREGKSGSRRVSVKASRYAVPIYKKLGFEPGGPEVTKNGITYLPMVFTFEDDG